MNHTARAGLGLAILSALSGCSTLPGSTSVSDIPLYVGKPLPTWQVTVADPENKQVLGGAGAVVPKLPDSKLPNSVTSASLDTKDAPNDALTLRWKDIWYAGLKLDGGAPLNLTPYMQQGTVEFDLKVNELAKGGIVFKMGCGTDCERKVSYVLPGRAAAGKGWQPVKLGLSCFVRAGDDFSAVKEPFALDGTGTGDVSIANIVIRAGGTPNTPCPDYRTVSVTPDKLNESWAIDWWTPRHQEKLADVARMKAAGVTPQVVFIGDSITHGWENEGAKVWAREFQKFNGLNLGFSGDRTENVLWRLQNGEVDGIAPKLAVLMFGTNNTGHRQEDPALTAAGIRRNIEELQRRLPNTKILLLAIFPRDEKPSGNLRQINEKVNALLSTYADNRKVFFLNLNQAFLQPDGTLSKDIMPDLLHPNEKGYQIWAEAMRPTFNRLMQP
jgi:beta-glucosidase